MAGFGPIDPRIFAFILNPRQLLARDPANRLRLLPAHSAMTAANPSINVWIGARPNFPVDFAHVTLLQLPAHSAACCQLALKERD
jgi:hypothetical protein